MTNWRINDKNILVTGGGGFIGSHVAKRLFDQGNHVRVVDRYWHSSIKSKYYSERVTMDLRKPSSCLKACKDIDFVFHFAADVGGVGYIMNKGADIINNNQKINLNMLDAGVKNNVERFFFSSSACVYPRSLQVNTNPTPLKESDAIPADPDSFYGWEKLMMEKECETYHKDFGLETRVARFHSVYGEGCDYSDKKGKVIMVFCRKVMEAPDGGVIVIWGNGKQTRTFIYIDDCVEGVLRLAKSNYSSPVNIGTEDLITVDHLADMVIRISGKKLEKKHDLSKPEGVSGRRPDLTLARKILAWEPKISIEEGLSRSYDWISQELEKPTSKTIKARIK